MYEHNRQNYENCSKEYNAQVCSTMASATTSDFVTFVHSTCPRPMQVGMLSLQSSGQCKPVAILEIQLRTLTTL